MKIISAFIILISLVGCNEDKLQPTVNSAVSGKDIPTQESWNAEILFTEEGNTKAILYANHLKMFDNQKTTYLEVVTINFFNSEGINSSVLTSDKAKVNEVSKDMVATENVVAKNDSGVVLKTEELTWKNKKRLISTDKFVTIDTKDEHIEGYGFESDEYMRNYKIYNVTYITESK